MIMKDIYNARQRIRSGLLNSRTPMQALVESFQADDFVWNVDRDGSGHVTHLFFTYRKSLELLQTYPEVLIMDCTYMSNRFDMPLFNIVGVTASSSTFFVAFTFLKREREEDYVWSLEQLRAATGSTCNPKVIITDRDLALMNAVAYVYPTSKHLLCQWHINKNVEARCWPFFRDLPGSSTSNPKQLWTRFEQDWHSVIRSLSESEFNQQWTAMKRRQRVHSYSLQYVETVWLRDHKERFVYAWTHQHLHFGTVVTSRVEGAHSVPKKYIGVSDNPNPVLATY